MSRTEFRDDPQMPSLYITLDDGTILMFLWGLHATYVDGNVHSVNDRRRMKVAIDRRASNGQPLPLWIRRIQKAAEKATTLSSLVSRLEEIAS
jgi:hypothetical protein